MHATIKPSGIVLMQELRYVWERKVVAAMNITLAA
jgi:hypothetical protein